MNVPNWSPIYSRDMYSSAGSEAAENNSIAFLLIGAHVFNLVTRKIESWATLGGNWIDIFILDVSENKFEEVSDVAISEMELGSLRGLHHGDREILRGMLELEWRASYISIAARITVFLVQGKKK